MRRIECFRNHIYEFESDKNLSKKILNNLLTIEWVDNNYNSLSKTNTLYELEEFHEIHIWFIKCLKEVIFDLRLEIPNIVIAQSWANKTLNSQSHHEHAHPNSFISGVFYLSSSEDEDGGQISFYNEATPIWYKSPFLLTKIDQFTIKPQIGKLLVFPSTLHHKVLTSKSNKPRYSIAFNSFPNGIIGSKNTLDYLNIKTEGFKINDES